AAREVRRFLSSSGRRPRSTGAMPLYVVLGSSDAGKSALSKAWHATAIGNETADDGAEMARFHVGEDAVFIELDGAFITQVEPWAKQLWPRVLQFLRSERPRQPLNGIVLTLGVDELLASTPE